MMQTNECGWKLHRTTVPVPVQLPVQTQEQSIELDYVLPDYYPDFFRLLSASADAEITDRQLRDGVLDYTLSVRLTVLYCAEQPAAVQSVTQQLEYHKQMMLPVDPDINVQVRLTAECAYLNCRPISPRRMDLRGAVRIRAQLTGERECEVLSGAEGKYLQSRSEPVSFVSKLLRTEKCFTLSDEISLSPAQPALLSVLREQITPTVSETRIVAGKLLIKGEVGIDLLYAASDGMETLHTSLPFSQIAEQNDLTDDMPCTVTASLAGHLISPESAQDGDFRTLHCELQICLMCTAVQTASADLLNDLYSTVHACMPKAETLPMLSAPVSLHESMRMKLNLRTDDRILTKVFAAWAVPEEVQTAHDPDTGGCTVQGMLHCCVMAADAENEPLLLEQRDPFTWQLPQISAAEMLPLPSVPSCTYTLSGSDTVTVQAELLLDGQILMQHSLTLLTDADIDENTPLPQEDAFALRLYFGQENESVWEIAKRYHTAADAIRAENDCPGDLLAQPQLLLIPSVKSCEYK